MIITYFLFLIVHTFLSISGGIIIMTCREDAILVDPYLKEHIEPEMKRLHDNGSWRWLKRETIPDYIDAYDGFFAVFEVL